MCLLSTVCKGACGVLNMNNVICGYYLFTTPCIGHNGHNRQKPSVDKGAGNC